MEYFWSGGGNNRPGFAYRFLMRKITDEMYDWCDRYPLTGPFERWHIIHNYTLIHDGGDTPETPLIQFESKKAALMFRIAYSEYIIDDRSIYSLDK